MGKNENGRLFSRIVGIMVLLAWTLNVYGTIPEGQTVTIKKSGVIGVGFQNDEASTILRINIIPDPSGSQVLKGDTTCTDNTGELLWRLVWKDPLPYRPGLWLLHNWRAYGAFTRNFRDQAGTAENYAAIIVGNLDVGGGGGGKGALAFSVAISDIDADVDALCRHQKDSGNNPVWPPTDVSHELNALEDASETGEDGGLSMPITDAIDALPASPANFSGKAMRIRFNAKKRLTFYPAGTIAGTKYGLYENGDTTQTRVSGYKWVDPGPFDKTYYVHTINGFTSDTISPLILNPPTSVGTAEMMCSYDTVRLALEKDKLFVNTPAPTDDYVPVEACGRVPVTFSRESSATAVELRLQDDDSSNPVKFFEAATGGTGVAVKTFTMAIGVSSQTFWVSGDESGLGERAILLLKKDGEDWNEYKSLAIVVYNLNLTADGVTEAQEESHGAYVPLNGDNDNGSAWVAGTSNHIPTKYDFDVSPITGENDLTKVTVSVDAGDEDLPGKIRIERKDEGRARIELWTTGTKTADVLMGPSGLGEYDQDDVPEEFFVEGRVPGAAERESEILLTYCPMDSDPLPGDLLKVTVTPVLHQLQITATAGAVPRLNHDAQHGWLMSSMLANGTLAFQYSATALVTNMTQGRGGMTFFQVTKNANHLANGNGAIRGEEAGTLDFAAPNAGKYLVDASTIEEWVFGNDIPNVTNNVLTVPSVDSPATDVNAVLPGTGQNTRLDVSMEFITYAVWMYETQNGGRSVIPLGATTWSMRCDGTLTPAAGGYTFAATAGGHNACNGSNGFTRTNDQPVRVVGPVANNANANWR